MAEVPVRSFCVQYREPDFTFVARLLAEEGNWLVRRGGCRRPGLPPAARGQRTPARRPPPAQPLAAPVSFHQPTPQQEQDAVVVFGRRRELSISHTTALS